MEKAILKTLIYYDIFDFPLKAWEIHKWLIGRNVSLKQIEKNLKRLKHESRIMNQGDFWFLPGRKKLIKERGLKEEVSKKHLQIAKYVCLLFKLIPWIKLVGISGSLAMMDSRKKDDIDLFIITSENRIWLSRFFLILVTSFTGLRRKRREKFSQVSGKVCINLILEENNLAQYEKNIYLAHEVLQMKVLWQRDEVYSKFLHANEWVFKYLPNWKSNVIKVKNSNLKVENWKFVDWLEGLVKDLQLKIMDSPSGSERIENGALYFHPEDKGVKIIEEYKKRVASLD